MRTRAATVAIGAVAAVVLAGGIARAYYLTAVAPTGTGSAATANGTVTLAITGSTTAALYPGGPAGGVTITVANSFTRPVTVNAIQAGTPVVTGAPGCTNPDLSVIAPTSGLPLVVAASSTSAPTTLAGIVSMGTNAQSACQGATITIPFTVTGQL